MKLIKFLPETENMNPLPTVLSVLVPTEKLDATFIKPTMGRELEALHEDNAHGTAPVSKVLAVRLMTLAYNSVIPFHVHAGKEKLYICQGPDFLEVMIVINGVSHLYRLTAGEQLIIPAGCPHCVGYFPMHHTLPCRVLVVTSSRDFGDIIWEDDADDLVENRHRK